VLQNLTLCAKHSACGIRQAETKTNAFKHTEEALTQKFLDTLQSILIPKAGGSLCIACLTAVP